MKRILKGLSVLLCVTMFLGLTACSSAQNEDGTDAKTDSVTIQTDAESYTVTAGQMVEINASVSDETLTLSYASADEAVATVNKYGKIIAVAAGTTIITIAASDGTQKTVEVVVEDIVYDDVLRVALNVLYNDTALGCANTEYGPYIEITEDGQYTVTFDATMNLSESSKKMGVTALKNMTAIFLYDQAVRDGKQMTSSVTACEIRWDSVVVNGQELTLTDTEFKSAIKSSGIFDSNDPLNAWDGSAVSEVIVDTENHILNIDVENPVSISVTFTIQGLTFGE